ncbi:uncharacterized protein ARMOST_15784 [Armillaria ostoyae]|uniref:Uncharacterized protein n=1 Tax=Armillaria ostoyae TaxID=47428 RepID=A0A284RUA8_ARMOS|nr:uncharacterized protein ARMOST_15784 [Armillaria ostoyae]
MANAGRSFAELYAVMHQPSAVGHQGLHLYSASSPGQTLVATTADVGAAYTSAQSLYHIASHPVSLPGVITLGFQHDVTLQPMQAPERSLALIG